MDGRSSLSHLEVQRQAKEVKHDADDDDDDAASYVGLEWALEILDVSRF